MRPAPPPDFAPPATTFSSEWGTGRCTAEFCPDFSIVEALTSQEIPSAYADGTAVFSMRRCLNNLELLGIPRVSLWVTCTRSDAAFAARLTVLPPPGICCLHPAPLLISSGICRLALRSDPLLPMLSDGEQIPVQLNFQLHPVSVRIPVGSMLRLEITSGDSPRFLPVLLAPSPAPRRWESTIWHNARHPSRLILPVLNKAPPSSAPNRI